MPTRQGWTHTGRVLAREPLQNLWALGDVSSDHADLGMGQAADPAPVETLLFFLLAPVSEGMPTRLC